MQHVDQKLKRFKPTIIKYNAEDVIRNTVPVVSNIVVMDEESDGEYVRYEDVKKLLQLLAEKVRML